MNYRKLEKMLNRAYRKMKKETGEKEQAMAEHIYKGMISATAALGIHPCEVNGGHVIKGNIFCRIYKNEDGACDCSLCEISAKCILKNEPDRLPDPSDPESIGLCPKWGR